MSANAENTTPQQPANKKGKRKSALLLLTLLFIIIAVAYGIYWFLVLRHAEETDDAYVAGNQVQIMAQVSGSVTKVWADNTDFVQKGDVLVTLDPTDAQQAFEKAQTALASSVRQTRQLMINSKQLQANIDVQKTALAQAQSDLNRRVPLGTANLIGREELQHARDAVASAQAQLEVAEQVQLQIRQQETNVEARERQVDQAKAQLETANLNLSYTEVRAPFDGFVTKRNVQPGTLVQAGTALFSLVSPNVWVVANFKESQLERMKPGDKVEVSVDAWPDMALEGHVDSIQQGSGSRFSAFPSENATGNFVKIVQRVPVKIVIDKGLDPNKPLPLGLSVEPKVTVE